MAGALTPGREMRVGVAFVGAQSASGQNEAAPVFSQSGTIRSSRTMPTLHKYTRADVREQYFVPAASGAAPLSTALWNQEQQHKTRHRNQRAAREQLAGTLGQATSPVKPKKRAKSNEQQRCSISSNSSDAGSCGPGRPQGQQLQQSAPGQQNQAAQAGHSSELSFGETRENKRRRSHSASRLFTACFNIPHHLLPGGGHQSDSHRLESEFSCAKRSTGARSILAHLRLGGAGADERNAARQRRPISASKTAAANLSQMATSGWQSAAAAAESRKHVSFEQQQRSKALASAADTNNVIVRNYQPAEQTTRALQAQGAQTGNQAAGTTATSPGAGQEQQQQSPIHLVGQIAGDQRVGAAARAPVSAMGTDATQPAHALQQRRAPPAAQQQQQQQQHQRAQTRAQHQTSTTATTFRRLPSVPMKTQATQTEITSYHLSSASGFSLQNCSTPGSMVARMVSSVRSPSPSSGATPASSSSTVFYRGRPTASSGESEIARSYCEAHLKEKGQEREEREREQKQEQEQDDEEEDEAREAGGNLQASLLSSSSNSSSSVESLVGHDSALADTLQCDLRLGSGDASLCRQAAATRQQQQRRRQRQQPSHTKQSKRPVSLKNDNDTSRSVVLAADKGRQPPLATSDERELNETPLPASQIEPPREFKDQEQQEQHRQRHVFVTGDKRRLAPLQKPPADMNMDSALERRQSATGKESALGREGFSASSTMEQANYAAWSGQQQQQQMKGNSDGADADKHAQPASMRRRSQSPPSPPSLSEASSQTDGSLASARVLERIGRALEGHDQQRAKIEPADEEKNGSVHRKSGASVLVSTRKCSSSTSGPRADTASAATAKVRRSSEAPVAESDTSGSRVRAAIMTRARTLATASAAPLEVPIDISGAAATATVAASAAAAVVVAQAVAQGSVDGQPAAVVVVHEIASQEASVEPIKAEQQHQEADETAQVAATGIAEQQAAGADEQPRPPLGRQESKTLAPEQRRDEFLMREAARDTFELLSTTVDEDDVLLQQAAEAEAAAAADQAQQVERGLGGIGAPEDNGQQADLEQQKQQQQPRKKHSSSTSTLSTRHHSYCAAECSEPPSPSLASVVGLEIGAESNGIDCAAEAAPKLALDDDDQAARNDTPLSASRPTVAAGGRAEMLARAQTSEATANGHQAISGAPRTSSTDFMGPTSAVAIGGGDERNDGRLTAAQVAFVELSESGQQQRRSLSKESAALPITPGCPPASAKTLAELEDLADEEVGKALDSCSPPSPPTTVSELDQEEELSTPSFVDNYKRRLEGKVCEFAERVANDLLGDCVSSLSSHLQQLRQLAPTAAEQASLAAALPLAAACFNDGQPQLSARGRRESRESADWSSSGATNGSTATTATTTTSASASYACAPSGGALARRATPSTKPPPPEKPAHLRATDAQLPNKGARLDTASEQAAAAIVVTATSIAAAAAAALNGDKLHYTVAGSIELAHALPRRSLESCTPPPPTSCSNSDRQIRQINDRTSDGGEHEHEREQKDHTMDDAATGSEQSNALRALSADGELCNDEQQEQADVGASRCQQATSVSSLDEPASSLASGSSSANSASTTRTLKQLQQQQAALDSCENFAATTGKLVTLATPDSDEQEAGARAEAACEPIESAARPDEQTQSTHYDHDHEQPPETRAIVSRQQSSNELLSTVSEASDELLETTGEQQQQKIEQQQQKQQHQVAENQQQLLLLKLLDLETTEQDLAQSDYTLNESEAAPLSALGSETATRSSSSPATASRQRAMQQQQQQQQMARTRSMERAGSLERQAAARRTPPLGVDCPYVRDIQPLSPTDSIGRASPAGGGGGQLASNQRRLSHDDTMEAIEDDVEGEEQELRLLQAACESPAELGAEQLCIAPPAAFSGTGEQAAATAGSPLPAGQRRRSLAHASDSIREEEEEEAEEADDDEEESSISVSRQHGVVITQASGTQLRRQTSSSSSSASTDSSTKTASSASSAPDGAKERSSPSRSESQREPLVAQDELEHESGAREGADEGSPEPLVELAQDTIEPGATKQQQQQREQQQQQQQPPLHSSTDSATHAILEHLSRHHPQTSSLGEEPALSPESRKLDPQLRRDGWRGESAANKQPRCTPCDRDTQVAAEASGELSPPLAETSSLTGTMKRRRKSKASSTEAPQEGPQAAAVATTASTEERPSGGAQLAAGSSGEQQQQQSARRGPPLKQLKSGAQQRHTDAAEPAGAPHTRQAQSSAPATSANKQRATQQASSSVDRTDTSICSSCSCMETSIDLQQQQQQQQKRPASGNWMSQEEGTVFTENYWLAHWLYISEHEEAEIWRRAIDMNGGGANDDAGRQQRGQDEQSVAGMPAEMSETSSSASEKSFSARYKSTTRKMIHRRATIEMYKRIMSNNLKREKRIEISRSNGEFGFRIHGSRPVVVSAIERGTSAETCGLQVGDLIYAINGTNILDMAHSDVVRLAHNADANEALVLDLIPTNEFLRLSKYNRANNRRYEPMVTGFLMRLSPSTAQPLLIELQDQMSRSAASSSTGTTGGAQQRAAKLNEVMRLAWRRRYFVLRSDNCLYWYCSPSDVEPHGGINLQGFSATLTDEFSEPNYVIRLVKYGGQPHYLGSNNMCDVRTWVDAINRAATEANQNDPYMKRTLVLARGKPNQIDDPDCSGWLYKFSHKRGGGAHWRAAYFVLKDACLYLFRDQQSELVQQASAVYYLHGYRVRSKHIEHKKHTFELIPPNRKTIKPIFLMASNEIDKKRWIAALEYSIDRWIEID